MTTLAQIIGVERGVRSDFTSWWGIAKQGLGTRALMEGLDRTYQPLEGRIGQPDESQRVQLNTETVLAQVAQRAVRYWDLNATRKMGDTLARADVTLADGTVLLPDVPVDVLIFLEGQLADLLNVLANLPVQSPAMTWEPTSERGIFKTAPVITDTSVKDKSFQVVVEPTQYQPADVREVTRDVKSGEWTTVLLTSTVTADRRDELAGRCRAVLDAVQSARTKANTLEVTDYRVAGPLLAAIFAVESA